MSSKLFAIIRSDRFQVLNPGEQIDDGLGHQLSTFLGNLPHQRKTRFSFGQGYQNPLMPFASEGVTFPISQAFSQINACWALFHTLSGRDLTHAIIVAIPFAPLLLAT